MPSQLSFSPGGDKSAGFHFHLEHCASASTDRRRDLMRRISVLRERIAELVSEQAAIEAILSQQEAG
jgi:hypothetical protein